MQLSVVFSCLIVAIYARPEAGFGYQPSLGYLPGQGGHTSQSYYPGGGNINNHVQDQKNVYFFAAPEEDVTSRFRIFVQPSSGRNTKVIFIKAPGQGGVIPEVIAPPSEAVDRTLVYVLSKHQKNGGSITIPANLGVKQAKPQVYFIKYRNQHEAQAAVQQGLNQQAVGAGLDDLGNAQAFTSTLNTGNSGVINGGHGGFTSGSHGGFTSGGHGGLIGGSHGGLLGGGFTSGSSLSGGATYGPPGGSGPY